MLISWRFSYLFSSICLQIQQKIDFLAVGCKPNFENTPLDPRVLISGLNVIDFFSEFGSYHVGAL